MTGFMDKLFRGIQILIAVFLGIMICLVFLNVVLRYVFSTGLAWSEEIARICFIYLVYLGTIDAYRDNRHLGVELLVERSGPKMQKVLYLAIQLIVIWMMVILSIGSWRLTMQTMNDHWVATGFPRALINGVGIVTGLSIVSLAVSNIIKLFVSKVPVMELMTPRDNAAEEFALE